MAPMKHNAPGQGRGVLVMDEAGPHHIAGPSALKLVTDLRARHARATEETWRSWRRKVGPSVRMGASRTTIWRMAGSGSYADGMGRSKLRSTGGGSWRWYRYWVAATYSERKFLSSTRALCNRDLIADTVMSRTSAASEFDRPSTSLRITAALRSASSRPMPSNIFAFNLGVYRLLVRPSAVQSAKIVLFQAWCPVRDGLRFLRLAKPHQRGVYRDPVEPCSYPRLPSKSFEGSIGRKKCVLRHVFRVFRVTHHAVGYVVDKVGMLHHQCVEVRWRWLVRWVLG